VKIYDFLFKNNILELYGENIKKIIITERERREGQLPVKVFVCAETTGKNNPKRQNDLFNDIK